MKKKLKTLIFTCFFMMVGFNLMAQQEVKGVVTDEAGEPLPGGAPLAQGKPDWIPPPMQLPKGQRAEQRQGR